MFQRLQNLRLGSRTVDEYATECFLLLNRIDLHDSVSQLVARFVGGLGQQIQHTLNLFNPLTLYEAHQQAQKQIWFVIMEFSAPTTPHSTHHYACNESDITYHHHNWTSKSFRWPNMTGPNRCPSLLCLRWPRPQTVCLPKSKPPRRTNWLHWSRYRGWIRRRQRWYPRGTWSRFRCVINVVTILSGASSWGWISTT